MTVHAFAERLVAGDVPLGEVLDRIWMNLEDGASGRPSGFNTPVLATMDRQGHPRARVLVLRRADRASRVVALHTDFRSAKLADLVASPNATLVAYDANAKTQIRISGKIRVHHDDDVARTAWTASTPFARRCYSCAPGPGTPVEDPASGLPDNLLEAPISDADVEGGFANFCVLELDIARIDWLHLTVDGNRAARFEWDDAGDLSASWRIP